MHSCMYLTNVVVTIAVSSVVSDVVILCVSIAGLIVSCNKQHEHVGYLALLDLA